MQKIACKTQSHHALKWNRGSNKFGDIGTDNILNIVDEIAVRATCS